MLVYVAVAVTTLLAQQATGYVDSGCTDCICAVSHGPEVNTTPGEPLVFARSMLTGPVVPAKYH